jgi:hypothetical protein
MTTKTSSARPARWPRWLFRVAVSCEALLALAQAILIGGFLQGHYPLLAAHRANAIFTAVVAILMTIAAVQQWRLGGGPIRPVFACLVVVAAIVVETILGFARVLSVHVPLGVVIIAADVQLLVWAWGPVSRRPPGQATPRPRPAEQPGGERGVAPGARIVP